MYNNAEKKGVIMKKKYYWGYLLNPEEVITDEFQEREKIGCIIVDDGEEKRELLTDAKFLNLKENEVIDGKKLFENEISLIGHIEKTIPMQEVVNFIFKSEIDKPEYINLLIKLISNTRKKAVEGFKEYYETEKTFKLEINKNRK